MKKQLIAMVLGAALVGVGCYRDARGDGPMENAGEKVDQGAGETKEKVGDAVEKAGDEMEKAGDKVEAETKR